MGNYAIDFVVGIRGAFVCLYDDNAKRVPTTDYSLASGNPA